MERIRSKILESKRYDNTTVKLIERRCPYDKTRLVLYTFVKKNGLSKRELLDMQSCKHFRVELIEDYVGEFESFQQALVKIILGSDNNKKLLTISPQ